MSKKPLGVPPELLEAAISSSVPDLAIMRMIKYLFKRAIRMIITTVYDEISAITKSLGRGSVYSRTLSIIVRTFPLSKFGESGNRDGMLAPRTHCP